MFHSVLLSTWPSIVIPDDALWAHEWSVASCTDADGEKPVIRWLGRTIK